MTTARFQNPSEPLLFATLRAFGLDTDRAAVLANAALTGDDWATERTEAGLVDVTWWGGCVEIRSGESRELVRSY